MEKNKNKKNEKVHKKNEEKHDFSTFSKGQFATLAKLSQLV